jgi:molybdate-binding protein
MSKEQADLNFGKVAWEDADFVVRVKRVNNEVHVFAHRKDANYAEQLPRAYMLGSNALTFSK